MLQKLFRSCVVAAVAAMGFAAFADDCYVATTGDDGNPGTAERPFATVAAAIGAASAGDTVHVAPGDYNEWNLRISKAIRIVGEGDDPSATVVYGFETPYSGTGRRIVYMTANATIENLTIRNGGFTTDGNPANGGNVYMNAGTITNCVISGGYVEHTKDADLGSGKKLQGALGGNLFIAGGLVVDCEIRDGGIYNKDGVLMREFLPAHDKSAADDSIARYGLFETVTGSFLPNCGKLSFGVKTTDLDRTFDVADIVTQNVSRAPCRPSVTVVDPKTGATLTEGTDYEVDYANNLAVGTAYVCVSGKAGTAYEGVSVYKHFTIGESALPEGYTKLAYIATTRKSGEAPAGQWVDTGYVPTCEDRFEIKVRTFDEKLAEGLFCSRLSATEATMAAVYPTASPKNLRFDCNTDNKSGVSSVERTAQEDTVIVADYKTRQCTIDGGPAATMAGGSFITAGPVALLGLYVGLSPYGDGTTLGNPAHARLYYFKVFDRNGKLVREYVPARDDAAEEGSRTQYGLYETVTATFHPNRGPVAFAAGDVVATSPSRTRFAVADIPPQVLKNPVACEPVVEVTDESTGAALVCGRDYEVRYADNDRAGTGRAVVSGKAGTDYEGLSLVKSFVVSYRRLGGRYQRVTFLRTDGNQFTDTGYTPSCTDRVEFRFKPGKLFVQGYYCSREDTTKNTFALVQPSADTTRLRFDRNTDNKNALSAGQIAAGRIYTVEADGSTLEARINGNPMATMEGGDFTPIGPFMLFSLYYGTSITPQMSSAGTPATCTFYEFRVWDKDGNLVCDCVPARDTEAEEGSLQQCGVYNLITRKFYPNYGKSAFAEYGADEPYVPGPMSGLMLIVR